MPTNNNFGITQAGVIAFAGAGSPGWMSNIGIEAATTTNANDSVRITSRDGSDFSATNPGWITLPGTTSGTLSTFKITANVTMNLTGAHWGHGTTGDLTDAILRVLAINDNTTLRWGVALLGGRHTLLTTDTNATATSVNLPEEVLCTAAVASATNHCQEVGHFRGNFDDTGGAAEDLWAVQTGVGDIVVGRSADGLWQPWNPVYTGVTAQVAPAVAVWTQVGRQISVWHSGTTATSNASTFTGTSPSKVLYGDLFSAMNLYIDNSSVVRDAGSVSTTAGSITMDFFTVGATWATSNGKRANFEKTYPFCLLRLLLR